jgi:hypothetical protein
MSGTKLTSSNAAIAAGAPVARVGSPGQPTVQAWTNEVIADLKVAQAKLKKLPSSRLQGAGDRLLRAIDVFLASVPNTRPAAPAADASTSD